MALCVCVCEGRAGMLGSHRCSALNLVRLNFDRPHHPLMEPGRHRNGFSSCLCLFGESMHVTAKSLWPGCLSVSVPRLIEAENSLHFNAACSQTCNGKVCACVRACVCVCVCVCEN